MNATILPNGLPIYKMMQYRTTGEKCKIVKVNPEIIGTEPDTLGQILYPLTVDISIDRLRLGIPTKVLVDDVSPYTLAVWNESMNSPREVKYWRRKKCMRTVNY